jgi:molecular chaperone DnaK (HSP70)
VHGNIARSSRPEAMERKQIVTIKRVEETPPVTLPERQVGGPQSGLPPPYIVGCELAPYLIVGLDFGVNYCRVSTFANGAPQRLRPHEYRALVEDALGIDTTDSQLVHSIKHCLAGDYIAKKGSMFYSCEEITSAFLSRIKLRVETAAERLLAKAVFSVPSCFTHSQRQTLFQAAAGADIAVLGLINEPTAAALDACYRNNLGNGKYLVISIGSYSFESSIVDVQNRLIEVKAIRASQKFSGRSITLGMVEGFLAEHGKGDPDELHVLLDRAKPVLDSKGGTVIVLAGEKFSILRPQVTKWLEPFADGMRQLLESLLAETRVEPKQLAGVILSGGATKWWLLTDLLSEFAGPDRAIPRYAADVSAGAATFAALLVRQAKDWVVWDAIANPVLVAQGSHIREVIAGNSPLPMNGHAILIPDEDGKTTAMILQKTTDVDNEVVQVAKVNIVEEIRSKDPDANVDLLVHATADGKLMFSARHTTLDVNLTVEVTEVKRERPVLDLTVPGTEEVQDRKPSAITDSGEKPADAECVPLSADAHGCGFTLRNYDGHWNVHSVRELSSAARADVQVFDELIAIDEKPACDLGKNIGIHLFAEKDTVKKCTFQRPGHSYCVELECSTRITLLDPEQMKLRIADATISGDPKRLVQSLIDYAKACQVQSPERAYGDARDALDRAVAIAMAQLSAVDPLRVEALCELCGLHAVRASREMIEFQAILVSMERTFAQLDKLCTGKKVPSFCTVTMLHDLAMRLDELRELCTVSPKILRLLESANSIATKHHRVLPQFFVRELESAFSRTSKSEKELKKEGPKRDTPDTPKP